MNDRESTPTSSVFSDSLVREVCVCVCVYVCVCMCVCVCACQHLCHEVQCRPWTVSGEKPVVVVYCRSVFVLSNCLLC